MKPEIPRRTAAVLCLLVALITFQTTLIACRTGLLPAYGPSAQLSAKLAEIQDLIDTRFIGKYDAKKLSDTTALGMVLGMGDRWSTYLTAEEYQQHTLNQAGELVGIGVSIFYDSADRTLRIREVYTGSPAQAAGLRAGDCILAADNVTLQKQGADALIAAVRGKAGTRVRLQIRRGSGSAAETLTITAERKKISKNVVHSKMLEGHIGYIIIDDFDGGADTQFLTALKSLQQQGAKAFVFDVRFNPGGLITVLTKILDPLLPEGKIVSLVAKDGAEKQYPSDKNALQLPMAVLVNSNSISAAELFAAALQEYGVATVVGEHTIGKGYAQRTYPLSDGSAVVLSDQKYYTPKGKNLANIGIQPDIPVALTEQQTQGFYQLTTAQDPQLQAAIRAVTKK